jgi:predicted ribosomally synthesized peptide with nif11-like leader
MTTEIERLLTDLKDNNALLEELASLEPGIEVTVAWANGKGYGVSAEELEAHIEEQNAELSDDDLDAVAGGIMGAEGGTMGVGPLPPGGHGPIDDRGSTKDGSVITGPFNLPVWKDYP